MGLTMEVNHDTPRPSEGSWDDEDDAIDLLQRTSFRTTLSLEETIPMLSQEAKHVMHVRLFSAVEYLQLPDFIVIAEPCTSSSVESELLQWGHHCRCWMDPESACAICWPAALHLPSYLRLYLYVLIDDREWNTVWLELANKTGTELDHMRLLHGHG